MHLQYCINTATLSGCEEERARECLAPPDFQSRFCADRQTGTAHVRAYLVATNKLWTMFDSREQLASQR